MVCYHCSSFGCHIAAGDVAPGFHLWALVFFVVVVAISVNVGLHSCSFWCLSSFGWLSLLSGQSWMVVGVESVAKKMKNSLMTSWQQTECNCRPVPFYQNNRSCIAHTAKVEPDS